jgi:DNA-binding LytR/AlgR family response regulator
MYKFAICDDDVNFADMFCEKLKKLFDIAEIPIDISIFLNGNELIKSEENFDVIFLDIEMPEIRGFEVARKLSEELQRNLTILVFCSSYENLVFESLDYQPFQFLRKNMIDSDLPDISSKLIYKLKTENCEYSFHNENGYYTLLAKNIKYIDIFYGCFGIYTADDKKHIAYGRIGEFYKKADKNIFIRIHRSYIVNCKFISKITYDRVLLDDGKTNLKIGRTYLKNLRKTYHQFMFGNKKL